MCSTEIYFCYTEYGRKMYENFIVQYSIVGVSISDAGYTNQKYYWQGGGMYCACFHPISKVRLSAS